MLHRTSFTRNFCSQLVSIIRSQESGPQPVISGNLEEIEETRAVVLTQNSIRPGTKLSIDCNMQELRGVAERCEIDDWLGFFVEVRLDEDSRWSRGAFTPEHFLAIASPH